MKKIISLSLAFCFIFMPIMVFAETADLPDSYYEYFSVDYIFYEINDLQIETYTDTDNNPLFSFNNIGIFYNEEIVHSYIGNNEILFFAAGNSIYRYHIESRIIDLIISDNEIVWFYPITAQTLLYAKGEVDYAGIACSDVTNSALTYYYYSILTNTSETTNNPEHSISLTGARDSYDIIEVKTRATPINGRQIPHADYPSGNSVYTGSDNGAYQCAGFGWFIYKYLWGSYSYGRRTGEAAFGESETLLKDIMTSTPKGSYIRFNHGDSNEHSVILLGANSQGIQVYHANWTGGKVYISFLTYSDLINEYNYDTVSYMQIPVSSCPHVVTSYLNYNDTYHANICDLCSTTINYSKHYANNTGYGICLACGYQGYITVGINKTDDAVIM